MLLAFSTVIFLIFILGFSIGRRISRKDFFLLILGFMLPDLTYLLTSPFGEEIGGQIFLLTNSSLFVFLTLLPRSLPLFYGTLLHFLLSLLLFSHLKPLYPIANFEYGLGLWRESLPVNTALFAFFAFSLIFMKGFILKKRNKADLLRCILALSGGFLLTSLEGASPLSLFLILAGVFLNDEYLRSVYHANVIYFCGIDGSGKSTHAEETVRIFSEKGVKIASEHFFKNPLVKSLSSIKRRVIAHKKEETVTYSPEFKRRVKRHFLPKLRAYFVFVDNILYIGLKLLVHKLRGEWTIADRFFYDYYLRLKLLGYNVKGLGFIYERLFPKYGVVFDVSPEIAYSRRREHPRWYYEKARAKYLEIAEKNEYPVLKTERPFEVVQKELNTIIEEYIKHQ